MNFGDLLNEYRGAGDPPPDGMYDCVCTKAEAKAASTGKPMIIASFRVLTGPEANKTITNNFVLSQENPNAFWFFVRHMAVFGIDQATLAGVSTDVAGLAQIAPHLVGKQARLTIQKQAGRNLPNVTGVEPVPGGLLSAAPQVQSNGAPPPQYPQAIPPGAPDQQAAYAPTVQPAYQAPAPTPGYDQAGLIPQGTPAVLHQGEMIAPQYPQQPPQAPPPQAPAPQPAGPPPQAQEQEVPQPPQVPF